METRPKHPHRGRYLLSLERRFSRNRHALELFLAPIVTVAAVLILQHSGILHLVGSESAETVARAAIYTTLRIVAAYLLALACAIPLAVAATHSPVLQKTLLPLFDIVQSFPMLAFFPVIIAFFINIGSPDAAAVFMLFLAMLWNIVFAVVGGIGGIPRDIIYAAEVFGLRGWTYVRRVILPAIVPQTVIGSILAVAQGWNIIIVAEVIRSYVPVGSAVQNLPGLGSMLGTSATAGASGTFITALIIVVLIIAIINFFIWQNLLTYAQRFRFE